MPIAGQRFPPRLELYSELFAAFQNFYLFIPSYPAHRYSAERQGSASLWLRNTAAEVQSAELFYVKFFLFLFPNQMRLSLTLSALMS